MELVIEVIAIILVWEIIKFINNVMLRVEITKLVRKMGEDDTVYVKLCKKVGYLHRMGPAGSKVITNIMLKAKKQ